MKGAVIPSGWALGYSRANHQLGVNGGRQERTIAKLTNRRSGAVIEGFGKTKAEARDAALAAFKAAL